MSTGAATPRQAILEDLSQSLGETLPLGRPSTGGLQAATVRGGRSNVVDLATVRFVKERRAPTRHVYHVTYEAVDPRLGSEPHEYYMTYDVVQVAAELWETRGSNGGAGVPSWTEPTVNLGGGGWPDRFSAGGVLVAAPTVVRVRLQFGNGVVLEDTVDNDVVVFVTDEIVEPPTTAVLLDTNGAEVRRHPVLPGH